MCPESYTIFAELAWSKLYNKLLYVKPRKGAISNFVCANSWFLGGLFILSFLLGCEVLEKRLFIICVCWVKVTLV